MYGRVRNGAATLAAAVLAAAAVWVLRRADASRARAVSDGIWGASLDATCALEAGNRCSGLSALATCVLAAAATSSADPSTTRVAAMAKQHFLIPVPAHTRNAECSLH